MNDADYRIWSQTPLRIGPRSGTQPLTNSAVALLRTDGLMLALLVAGTLGYFTWILEPGMQPHEDAAMLLRYAVHFAEGHGLVWNIGEAPVDGATDFLLTVVLAGFVRLGVDVETAARLVGMASHLITVIVVFGGVRILHGASVWASGASAAYLAVGPGAAYVAAAFGTPLFGMLAALTWVAATRYTQTLASRDAWIAATVALLLGLNRPEGVLLAGFIVLAVLYSCGWERGRGVLVPFSTTFLVVGGSYFAWHWYYFGHPLPNPFYLKGGGVLYWDSLVFSVKNTIWLAGPFLIAFGLGIRSTPALRKTIFAAIPVVGFTACWVLLSNDMNMLARFQYATLPIVLIAWPAMVSGLFREWGVPAPASLGSRQRLAVGVMLAMVAVGMLTFQIRRYTVPAMLDGRYDVALMLQEYAHKGYTLATSEAGLLPFYSEWRTIDTWGLNDAWIAHNGIVTHEYLDRTKPHVVMFNGPNLGVDVVTPLTGPWGDMVSVLREYCRKRNYRLVAAYGLDPYVVHHYYVRNDFADTEDIAARLQLMTYQWRGSSKPAINYAQPAHLAASD